MIKRLLFITIISISLLTPPMISGQSPAAEATKAPSTSPTLKPTQPAPDKIQELKDKVASRVAQLKEAKITGLSGKVKSAADQALVIVSSNSEYQVQLDEETTVYEISETLRKREIKASTLEKDDYITILGVVNQDDLTAQAYAVVSKKPSQQIVGTVKDVSTKDGTITVTTVSGQEVTADIEVSTVTRTIDTTKDTLPKIGLSRITVGSPILIYAAPGEKENRVLALRVLIPSGDQNTITPSPTNSESPQNEDKEAQ